MDMFATLDFDLSQSLCNSTFNVRFKLNSKVFFEDVLVFPTNLAERQSKVSSDALEILIEIFCDSENEKKNIKVSYMRSF